MFSILTIVPTTIFWSLLDILFSIFETPFRKRWKQQGEWGPLTTACKINWARMFLGLHGIKLEVSGPGAGKTAKQKGVIFVSNHQSALDIPVASLVLNPHSAFLSKKELGLIPIFGWAAAASGVVFIDRAKGTKNKSLQVLADRLRHGLSIIIFPEGTRSTDGQLLKFKRGAFVMAIESQIPVVPMVIFDSRKLLPKHRLSIGSGTIHVWIGDEIPTKGLKLEDRHQLTDKIADIMAKQLENFDKNRKNN